MVRANCANRNAEIHATLSCPRRPEDRRFNAPSPAAGGGTGCALALGPSEGERAWGALRARLRRASLRREAATLAHA
jgi:hypothetical protein